MSGPVRVAGAIDVGSNSVHLLLAELGGATMRVLRDESALMGLGAMVDMEGFIPEAGIRGAVDVLRDYVGVATAEGAAWVTLLATEPLRRASNRSHVCSTVEEATGWPLDVLSHEEEALLTVLGVLAGEPVEAPLLVLDIGGGSSEITLLEPGADPVVGILPVGSARLTAQHVEDDPPTAAEVAALRAEAHHLLAGMPAGHPRSGIIVGGSGTNLLRFTAEEGDERAAGGPWIDRPRAARAIETAMSRPSRELAETYGLRERRVLQMAAGASLIEAALDCYGLDRLEASDASLREGAIIARTRLGEHWREGLGQLVSAGRADARPA
jgi:exopolyphosphatase/guanosine-5'-triphosphate,3'-diphosphate pyrophosphatase